MLDLDLEFGLSITIDCDLLPSILLLLFASLHLFITVQRWCVPAGADGQYRTLETSKMCGRRSDMLGFHLFQLEINFCL